MKLGIGKEKLTPHKASRLAGFAARRDVAGVHDDLYARVFSFHRDDSAQPYLIIQLDVLNVDHLYMKALSDLLAPLGINEDNFIVFCSHTHSAQGGIFDVSSGHKSMMREMIGDNDPELLQALLENSMVAIKHSLKNPQEFTSRIAHGTLDELGTNRHSPDMRSDQNVFLIEFTMADGAKALLYNLACHPTVMNHENMHVTADWPGAVNAILGSEYSMVTFFNGSCGDMSTRFTRKESTFDEVNRYGEIVASKLRSLLSEAKAFDLSDISLSYHGITLQEAEVDSIQVAGEKLAQAEETYAQKQTETDDVTILRKAYSFVEGARMNYFRAQAFAGHTPGDFVVNVGLIRLGSLSIICSPFELYSVLAMQLKDCYNVEMFGYSNCLLGYMADADSYDAGDYEALSSRFAKGQGEVYIQKLMNLLKQEGIPAL